MNKKLLFYGGLAIAAIPVWDSIAVGTVQDVSTPLPLLYPNSLGEYIPEYWLGIIGLILILLALFL